ncbi:MAG TPA: hypothetical protein VGB04_00525 [Allosphingosinicella sp.]|jgi:hypothetical protein
MWSAATIRKRDVAIAVLPALVFLISQLVLREYAEPFNVPPERLAKFDVYKEGAARISTLAAFMLFVGGASAALLFFAYTLKMFNWLGRGLMAAAMVALALSAVIAGEWIHGRSAEQYIGTSFACLASNYSKAQSDAAGSREEAVAKAEAAKKKAEAKAEAEAAKKKAEAEAAARPRTAAQGERPRDAEAAPRAASATGAKPAAEPKMLPGVPVKYLPAVPKKCSGKGIERMRSLEWWQAFAVVFAFSALVFGAICCLATPARASGDAGEAEAARDQRLADPERDPASPALPRTDPEPEPGHWEAQSEWLNTYLYLSALLLGTVLIFLNAYLRWPAFALVDPKPYETYASALLAFYGFTFTVMLAAFYIPVAVLLSRKVKKQSQTGAPGAPDAFKGPVQLIKILLGLFSPALAGMLPNILDKIV